MTTHTDIQLIIVPQTRSRHAHLRHEIPPLLSPECEGTVGQEESSAESEDVMDVHIACGTQEQVL